MKDEIVKPKMSQAEREKLMKKFLENGGKIEKCPPGSAYRLGSLDRSGKPQWSNLEIRAGKEKK